MKKIIITSTVMILHALLINVHAQSQKPEIVTDRPDQTEAPVLVPRGAVQVETGFVYENDREQNVNTTNYTYNTTLIKYGINENFEFRFISEYLGEQTLIEETPVKRSVKGLSPLAFGFKVKLADERGFWPQAALIGHINIKSGAKEFAPDYTAADFRFTFAHTLSDKFSLSYNLGAEWNGETPEADFLYTLSLGYAITKRMAAYIETYSFFPETSKADNRADAGITYKFTPVVQWDVSGGIGLCSNAPDYFLSTGISFRLLK